MLMVQVDIDGHGLVRWSQFVDFVLENAAGGFAVGSQANESKAIGAGFNHRTC